MDTSYQRRLLMLQGSQGQTGFVNLERKAGRLTLKFQVVGLPRGATDVHGQLVSLRKKQRYDCGRLRVDARGQGGLLAEWFEREMEGLALEDCEVVLVTSNGQALLAGALGAAAVDWEAVRAYMRARKQPLEAAKPAHTTMQIAQSPTSETAASRTDSLPKLLEKMMPNEHSVETEEGELTAAAANVGYAASLEGPRAVADEFVEETIEVVQESAVQALETGHWPDWESLDKQVYEWPSSAEDLRVLFERGKPYEQLELPGWQFVRTPATTAEPESVLGVFTRDGRVVQTACLLRGEEAPEPPAGLEGYVYARNIGDGYWTQWRDYDVLEAEDDIG